jgi:hypothetical protein
MSGKGSNDTPPAYQDVVSRGRVSPVLPSQLNSAQNQSGGSTGIHLVTGAPLSAPPTLGGVSIPVVHHYVMIPPADVGASSESLDGDLTERSRLLRGRGSGAQNAEAFPGDLETNLEPNSTLRRSNARLYRRGPCSDCPAITFIPLIVFGFLVLILLAAILVYPRMLGIEITEFQLDPTFFPPIEFQLIPPRYSFLCSI